MNIIKKQARRALALSCAVGFMICADSGAVEPGGRAVRAKRTKAQSPTTPLLGKWALSGQDASGKKCSATLVFTRQNGNAVRGYFRWRFGSSQTALELFSGFCERSSGTIRLEGYELQGHGRFVGFRSYEAILSASKDELREGSWHMLMGAQGTGTWSARWVDKVPDKLPDSALEKEKGEWAILCRNLSGGFVKKGLSVWRYPCRNALRILSSSEAADIVALAELRLGLECLREKMLNTRASPDEQSLRRAAEVGRMIVDFTAHQFGRDNDATDLVRDVTDEHSSLYNEQMHRAQAMWMSVVGLSGESLVRSRVIQAARKRRKGSEFPDKEIRATFKIVKPDDGLLTVRNCAKKDLHHCLIITELAVDKAKVAEAALRQARGDAANYLLGPLLGIDDATLKETAKLQAGYWAWVGIDKGTVTYLHTWKDGTGLDVGLSPLTSLAIGGEAASLSVYSDEGWTEISLPVSSMKAKAVAAIKPKPRSRPRPRTRR
ncbi:MAG: hypothetical protein HS101_08060 [Planctomycetia bacterium]|nr:hypothetical protein [Planctomycetia bacterium]